MFLSAAEVRRAKDRIDELRTELKSIASSLHPLAELEREHKPAIPSAEQMVALNRYHEIKAELKSLMGRMPTPVALH